MSVEEKALVERTLEGDQDAFGALVEKYQGAVYGLAVHLTGRYADAEDIAQEVFLTSYKSLSKLKDRAKYGSWVRGITCRLCKNWLRKEEKRRKDQMQADADEMSTFDSKLLMVPKSFERELEVAETHKAVQEAIASLPEKYQLPVTLRYLQELSYQEIARFMGVSVGTVRGILYRANKLLREELGEFKERGTAASWHHANT
jgi:RNA polymerase sigma-70 factor (ECF subfamily)